MELGFFTRPGDQPARVSTVGEHRFYEAPEPTRRAQQRFGAIAVLNAGGVNLNGQKPTFGVCQDVPLAARDLLARVVAFGAPF